MSNLYVTEPATNAKVIIETTAGEIEVEMWGKECPKAVRNFLALSMEGYYDGVIFHRIVPGFIIQTGDPTGTGKGGESFYGEPFQDEKHGRLRFNRRGLMGMANSGKRNTNTSQFFFTLDKAEELTNNHTLFGKVIGNTLYNVMDIGQLDIDAEEKPLNPPKIKNVRIVENPFDDIVPRITAAEKRAQQQARLEAKQEADKREKKSRAKKNTALLSFGEAEEGSEEPRAEKAKTKRKGLTRQDLVEDEPVAESSKRAETYVDVAPSLKDLGNRDKSQTEKKAIDIKEIRAKHLKEQGGDSESRQAEIKRMQEDLRKLKKAAGDDSESDSDSSEARRKRRKRSSYLEQELAKYSKGRGRAAAKAGSKRSRRDEEDDLLAELGAFSKRVAADAGDANEDEERAVVGEEDEEGLEVDDDVGWMKHSLKFMVDEKELTRRAEEEYSVIDPRAKARQLAQEERREKDGHRKGRTAADVGRR